MISLDPDDFKSGGLNRPSDIRPDRLWTTDIHPIISRAGVLKEGKINQVIDKIIEILNR